MSQDKDLEQRISNLGLKSFYIPNGVKLNKFKFVNSDIPSEIKKQINPQKKYLLHIGHLKKSRGLSIIYKIPDSTNWCCNYYK